MSYSLFKIYFKQWQTFCYAFHSHIVEHSGIYISKYLCSLYFDCILGLVLQTIDIDQHIMIVHKQW